MIVDTFSIIISATLILLAIVTSLLNPFFRKIENKQDKNDDNTTDSAPKLSILLLAYEETKQLQKCLSAVLGQIYEQEYEVIVVIEKGDIAAEEALKPISDDKRVYTTFIPNRSLFMSRRKLAVSLGVKAAHNDWIVVVKPNDNIPSSLWLQSFATHMKKGIDLVIGYANYNKDANSYHRFLRMRTSTYMFRKAFCASAYRTDSSNIAFRKEVFINGDGYRGNLHFTYGEFDFIINKYARKGNTAISLLPETYIREEADNKKIWHTKNIALQYCQQSLKRTASYHACYYLDLFSMYINYIAITTALIYSLLCSNYVIFGTAIASLITTICLRTFIAKKTIERFDENISALKIVPFELSLLFNDLIFKIRYLRSDKNDYITHKL